MKTAAYTDIICRRFCNYYKEGKEELACETYNFLAKKFALGELESRIQDIGKLPEFLHDEEIKKLICEKCDFLVDGCDFREGLDSPPCGGYTIVEWLIKNELLRP